MQKSKLIRREVVADENETSLGECSSNLQTTATERGVAECSYGVKQIKSGSPPVRYNIPEVRPPARALVESAN